MTYIAADARQQLLAAVADATDRLAFALAAFGEAYEQLDEGSADRLEQELFLPVQRAYGTAQRTYAQFAARHRLAGRAFEQPAAPGTRNGAKGLIELAVEAVAEVDGLLSTLQDSMVPIEVGDAQLRSGLQEVRQQVSDIRTRARAVLRVLGR